MRLTTVIATSLAILVTSGCMTGREWYSATPSYPTISPDQHFSFIVQSDPPGAEVYQQVAGRERLLGTTPLNLNLWLARSRDHGALNFLRRGTWKARVSANSPIAFKADRDTVSVRIPDLILRKKNYKEEHFSGQWTFPDNLKRRTSMWQSVPIERNYRQTVFFKTPTAPLAVTSVTIDCATGAAKIYALDAQGKPSRLVGTTPLLCKIGYGSMRSKLGGVTDWLRWHENDKDLWESNQNGDVFLNCILVRDGYEPEKIWHRLLFKLPDQPAAQQTAMFQFSKPTKPEVSFKLHFDSLPSDAAVYALNLDGSLGQVIGKTPLDVVVGMAQENFEETPGRYVHKDWRIWAPGGIVRWDSKQDGTTFFKLTCAVYKDGFAVENIVHPIFQLKPGMPYPEGMTLTIPLPSSEQAAVRESHRLQQARMKTLETESRRKPSLIWQAPPQADGRTDEQHLQREKTPPEDATRRRSWWSRIWQRKN